MSLNNFIPELWSDQLLVGLRTNLVYGQELVINRDYEGEIKKKGNTVRITSVGDPTIGDYTKDTDISSPEALTDSQATLTITEQKYFNFEVDDVDEAQGNPAVMDQAMLRSAYQLAKISDLFLAAKYTEAGSAIGTDGTPKIVGLAGGDTNAYNLLVDTSVALDEADVPLDGRWVIVPAWFYGLLLKDDRFTKSGTPLGDMVKANGSVGREVSGLAVLKSNNVSNTSGTKYKILGGHRMAWSYAEQVNQVEGYRPEKRFADAVKGLQLYGAKVVRPNCLVVVTASKGTL